MKNKTCPNCEVSLSKKGEMYGCKLCGFNRGENDRIIDTLYLWLSVDDNGMEGIMAEKKTVPDPGGNGLMDLSMTVVSSKLENVDWYRKEIHEMVREGHLHGAVLKEFGHNGVKVLDRL